MAVAEEEIAALEEVITSETVLKMLNASESSVISQRMTAAKKLVEDILLGVQSGRGQEALQIFSRKLNSSLAKIIDDAACFSKFSTRKERMWRQFHSARCKDLKLLWKEFMLNLNLTLDDPLLMQSIFEEGFSIVTKSKFQTVASSDDSSTDLNEDEHNALRYTAGFIPQNLVKKLAKSSHPYKDIYIKCLSEMGVKGFSEDDNEVPFHDFTKKWINAVNRGGLFSVKDEVYMMFLELEIQTRQHLSKLLMGGKISKSEAVGEICGDDEIQFHWCLIATAIEDESASQELLHKIVDLWITIRGFSSAGSYVENYKQCAKASSKKSVGLRKGLKRKYDNEQP